MQNDTILCIVILIKKKSALLHIVCACVYAARIDDVRTLYGFYRKTETDLSKQLVVEYHRICDYSVFYNSMISALVSLKIKHLMYVVYVHKRKNNATIRHIW